MILKPFYDVDDYRVVMFLLHGYKFDEQDRERVKTRQLFLELVNKK